jgi:NADPH:quinone reductase-like Zn-dependent oxidoreductase
MKAIILKEQGDASNLILTDLPIPEIEPDEVLVRVKAVGINPSDTYIRKLPALNYVFNGEYPRILGWDIAGIITRVGEKVSNFKPGDAVFGTIKYPGHDHPGHGKGYAEYVAAPASDIVLKPANISFEEAAAATLAALTAWQPLSKAGIKPGDRVLITAAGGGVGHYAIQIAKYLGAYVIALASAAKKDFVLSLGADEHIDYKTQSFEKVLAPVDLAVDALRDDHIAKTLQIIKPGGKLISLWSMVQGTKWETLAKEKGIHAYYNAVKSDGKDMQAIADLLAAGHLRSHVSKTFTLEETADAHREIEKDNTTGKIVLNLHYE